MVCQIPTLIFLVVISPSVGWELLESEKYLGVPGVPVNNNNRQSETLQGTNCNCNQAGCGCSSNLYCANTGLCYQCSQYNCNNRPAGCGCGQGRFCSSSGQCAASCNCQAGWICGADGSCQHPSTCSGFSCNGYGTPVWTGSSCSCSCNLGFDSNNGCGQCSNGYSGFPTCRSVANCNGFSCGNQGSPYWQGGSCTCICNSGYTGISCTGCSAGYSGYPFCRISTGSQSCSSTICSGRGSALWDVSTRSCTCRCNAGYTGPSCDRCSSGFTNYPFCSSTTLRNTAGGTCSSAFCNNHGVASWTGTTCVCTCQSGFAGVTCGTCAPGFFSYPFCSPGGTSTGFAATPTPQTFISPSTRGVSGGNSSDDDLPAAVIAVIVIIAVCLVIAGIAAVVYTRRRGKKNKPTDPPHPEFNAATPSPKVYGSPPPSNPIGSFFEVPTVGKTVDLPPQPPIIAAAQQPPPLVSGPQIAIHG